MSAETVDIFVIGGGINGCGIARDAAGRGFSVMLAERDDLACGTSSASTKLVHGGLRYLEHYEFRLVREALKEREVLWRNAPHVIWPLRLVLPHHRDLRPAWLIRLGLFLYDHIGGRRLLPPTRVLDLHRDEAGEPLKPEFTRAFEFSDCWANDARLVVLNARDAADRGARILTRTEVVSARRDDGLWRIETVDRATGERSAVSARLLVNAAGPWVDQVLGNALGGNNVHNVRLVKGSHIVIARKYAHERSYFFQNRDGRIFFAIPFESDFTLIGTTDLDYDGSLDGVAIADDEIDYLCAGASEYFREPVTPDDIIWTFSGVRPLFDDGATRAQEATRDYVLKTDGEGRDAVLINIFGGKITTYRRLAETVLARIEEVLGRRGERWTAAAPLPGGDFPQTDFEGEVGRLRQTYPFLEAGHARRLVRQYGTTARAILGPARSTGELGEHFGADLYGAEVGHLIDREWARKSEDVLWRRTKCGLRLTTAQVKQLDRWMDARRDQSAGHAAE
ncbi:MAG: glycerol-3-phosphate dehydrogenase [Alphaproteobacteria bacterium]|nr:MAG: glycerol-3-phosphate dehydrogenase [Alphaproteobacteria bacterium]